MTTREDPALDCAQREAVRHGTGPLRVVGGPGGGKTRVLTRRIAWLVGEEGIDPEHVLALTFTNRAAGELKQRLQGLLGEETPVTASTIHSWAYRFLCVNRGKGRGGLLGAWNPNQKTAILADARQYYAWKQSVRAADVDMAPAWAMHLVSRAKGDGVSREELRRRGEEQDDEALRRAAAAWAEYEKWQRHARVIDFDDLLLLASALLDEEPVRDRARDRHRWVMLDESQDTNRVQWQIIHKLCPPPAANLTVVGDYDQSIYGWRGAAASSFLEFVRTYDARTVRLQRNYRSTARIVRAANRLIEANRAREDKRLDAVGPEGESPEVALASDAGGEASLGVERIRRWLKVEGHEPGEVAVLVRAWWLTRAFEERLLKGRIPYRVVGGPGFFGRREVQDVLAYVALAVDPRRDLDLERILNVPTRYLGASAWKAIERHATRRDMPALLALSDPGMRWPKRYMRDRALDLFALVQSLRGFDGTTQELIRHVLERTGYLRHLKKECEPGELADRRDNIEEMIEAAEEHPEPADFVFYAEQLQPQAEEEQNAVTLTSIHGAKGLEFPCVLVAGCAEKILPHERCEDVEEERRLAYVAMTRAEKHLLLTAAEEYRHKAHRPSRFLEEAGLEVPELPSERRQGGTDPDGPGTTGADEPGAVVGVGSPD